MNARLLSRLTRAELQVEAAVAARAAAEAAAVPTLDESSVRFMRVLLKCPEALDLVLEIARVMRDQSDEQTWLDTDPWALRMKMETIRLTMSVPNREAILAGEAYE